MSYRPLPDVAEPADELRQCLRHERDATRKARLHLLVPIQDEQVPSRIEARRRIADVKLTPTGLWQAGRGDQSRDRRCLSLPAQTTTSKRIELKVFLFVLSISLSDLIRHTT